MRVIAKRTLREFYELASHQDARGPLEAWHAEATKAIWQSPHDIKAQYGNASIISDETVVFNIAGNKYRLVVNLDYGRQTAYVKFVGTHEQYDKLQLR
ncbi:MAG: type II toxin-antitoxin system HigB family toxin [Gammaproteobacteria bacterium]|nr:type II toxin-antitoxin system HigB family toxin [Gammaproteobacteria bacterium]